MSCDKHTWRMISQRKEKGKGKNVSFVCARRELSKEAIGLKGGVDEEDKRMRLADHSEVILVRCETTEPQAKARLDGW